MKIKKSSLFIRWAYLPDPEAIPDVTNVCDLFGRAFFGVPVFFALLILLSPRFLIFYLDSKGWFRWMEKDIPVPNVAKVAQQRIRDWHDGICTIVEIE